MSRRYEQASTVRTSTMSFEEWGEIFGEEVMAAALIDRLLPHRQITSGSKSPAVNPPAA